MDGGDTLKSVASGAVETWLNATEGLARDQGTFAVFDLKHDFATEWPRFARATPNPTERTLSLGDILEKVPYFASYWKSRLNRDVVATEIVLVAAQPDLPAMNFQLLRNNAQPTALGATEFAGLKGVGVFDTDVRV